MEQYIENAKYIANNINKLDIIQSKLGNLSKIPQEIIVAIIENYEIFAEVNHCGLYMTWEVRKALDSPFNKGVVVYFEEIKLYCSTDYDTYLQLCDNLHSREYNVSAKKLLESEIKSCKLAFVDEHGRQPTDDELTEIKNSVDNIVEKTINMYQIVLTTSKQKLVFAFNTNDKCKIQRFKELLNKIDKVELQHDNTDNIAEITFNNKLFNNKKEVDKYVKYLKTEISKINTDYSELISTIKPIILYDDIKYCEYNVNSIILDKPTDEQLQKILKTTLNVNSMIINMGTINGNGIVNTTSGNDTKSILEKWLILNPITSQRVLQSEYRQKFTDDTGITITSTMFGKLASKYVKGTTSNGKTFYIKK